MVLYSLTNRVYTPWGKQYQSFHWRASWWVYTNLEKTHESVRHIIYWFDTNILQRIGKDTKFTLDVRIRIVCGMVNKLSSNRNIYIKVLNERKAKSILNILILLSLLLAS